MRNRQPVQALACRICDAAPGKPHLKGCPSAPLGGGASAGANKYSAKAADCGHGHVHPSRKEARRCAELHVLQRAGQISDLVREPVFTFEVEGRPVVHDNGQRARFRPDFQYRRADGQLVVEDSKGVRVRDWPLRKALFRACYPNIEMVES